MDEQNEHVEASTVDCKEILTHARLGALRAGATGDEVEEVSQITAAKLIEKWNTPHIRLARRRGTDSWNGYIAKSARHSYYDLIRSRRRRRARESTFSGNKAGSGHIERPGTIRPISSKPSNIDHFLGRQLIVDLVEQHLSGPQQEVALLLLVDGLSIKEIAVRLDRAERTIRQHKKAGLAVLADRIQDTSQR